MRAVIDAWPSADKAPSRRSVPGTVGLYVPAGESCSTSPDAFLLGREFAHHHQMMHAPAQALKPTPGAMSRCKERR